MPNYAEITPGAVGGICSLPSCHDRCDLLEHVAESMRTAIRPGDSQDHDPSCTWPTGYACSKFSTDGTRTGAIIAHSMGTMDEEEIARMALSESDRDHPLTGMPEEQADWEMGLDE